jgi:hypothetical protein
VRFIDGCRKGIGDEMATQPCSLLARTVALLALLLIGSHSRVQPAEPAPTKVVKQTFYNGGWGYIYYQVPPDAPPRIQALYRALGQAENDQRLADELQQLLLEYTEQERLLGSVRASRELLYGCLPKGCGPCAGYISPDGATKAATVQALVIAADARSRFAGQVNRDLETLQRQAAGKVMPGAMSALDAVRQESVALATQRKAWQACQEASQRVEEASRLVEQAAQMEQQAADDRQSGIVQRLLRYPPWLTVRRYLTVVEHGLAQKSAEEAKRDLDDATVELHAAQAASMSALTAPPSVPNAAAGGPKAWPAPPRLVVSSQAPAQDLAQAAHRQVQWNLSSTKINSARAEQMAAAADHRGAKEVRDAWLKERDAFLKEQEAWQKEASASSAERSAALAARRTAQEERLAAQKERTAIQRAEAFAQQPRGIAAVASPVLVRTLSVVPPAAVLPPHQPAAQPGAPFGSWAVAGCCVLGAMVLLALGLAFLLHYQRMAIALRTLAALPPGIQSALQSHRPGSNSSALPASKC